MDLVNKAVLFVMEVMDGKRRKTSKTPAYFHSLEAGVIAASLTDDSEIIVGALLHDVIEDANVTQEEVGRQFGKRVMRLVLSETENKRREVPPLDSWQTRKDEAIDLLRNTTDAGTRIIFLADKLSNMRSLANDLNRYGTSIWQSFNQKDIESHHWYYRTIADILTELKPTLAWREYDRLITSVFNEN